MASWNRLTAFAIAVSALASSASADSWNQWGGGKRNFCSAETGLIDKWGDAGPKVIWKRELGEGYSAIVTADDSIYTMFRRDDDETIIALDRETGHTRWAHTYAAPLPKDAETGFGRGPNATPLIAGDRLVTVGVMGKVHCLSRKDGSVIWSTDLLADHGAAFLKFGYSASPLLYRDTLIFPIGAKDKSVIALGLADGKPRWASADYENSYSTPVLVELGGRSFVTLVMAKEIIGLSADDGKLAWTHPYKNQWDTHCTTPVDCGEGRVFYPSFEGGVLLQLASGKDAVEVKELWKTKKVGAGQTNVIRVGDLLFGASGNGRAAFFSAVKLSDGTEAWRERLALSNVLLADGRLIILDENGELRLAKPSSEKLDTICQSPLLESRAWTAPSLADGRLYLRDQKTICAIDLRK